MQKLSSQKPGLKSAATLVVTVLLLAGCAAKPPVKDYKPWGTFLHDDSRSNISSDAVTLPMSFEWGKNISKATIFRESSQLQLSSPVISEGRLFTGSSNDTFYTFDLRSGKVLWSYDAEYPIEAPAAVSGSNLCFGSSNGIMRCLDKTDGKLLWSFQAKSEILSAPVIKDGKVFFSSSDDKLYALSLSSGEKLWSYSRTTYQTVSPRVRSSPAVSGSTLYQFFSDGVIAAVSAETGKELWARKVTKNFDTVRRARRTPLIAGGLVYIIDDSNAVVALAADSGDVKGFYNIIKTYDFLLPDSKTLVMAGADRIVAINRVTGAILWKTELKYSPVSTVFAAGEHLFAISNYTSEPLGVKLLEREYGFITALRLSDGTVDWTLKLPGTVTANGSSAENTIAVLTDNGLIEVYKGR